MFKVLIIDDEEIIREGLRVAVDWGSMDCTLVGEAEDGDDGFELVKTLKPDIIFTDIRMPGLNGLDMILKIKELKHECRIIILTGFRDFEYAQEAVRLGAFRLLLKPTKEDELISTIKEAAKELKKLKSEHEALKNLQKIAKERYGLSKSDEDHLPEGDNDTTNSKYLVNKALATMKSNYNKDLSLKSVSDELYISTWHLCKVLKKETGSTFVDILNEIRIEEAKKFLDEPKYKVYEVANMVGFSDIPYFTKLFKKTTGFKPLEYKIKKSSSR